MNFFDNGFFWPSIFRNPKPKPHTITFDDVKTYVLTLDDHQRGVEMSELVKAAFKGKRHLHSNPYTVTPRIRDMY